jgi:hypothetical protein
LHNPLPRGSAMRRAVIAMETRVSQCRGVAPIRLDASTASGVHRSVIRIRHDHVLPQAFEVSRDPLTFRRRFDENPHPRTAAEDRGQPIPRGQDTAVDDFTIRREAGSSYLWAIAFIASLDNGVLARAALVWMSVLVSVSSLNTLRVLGAHEYETDGHPRSRLEQLQDSIDTPGGPWTELWAPVGLRYHALHHYFPGIPYHNLGAAYRRLIDAPLIASQYRESTSPGLRASLSKLYASAKRGRRA